MFKESSQSFNIYWKMRCSHRYMVSLNNIFLLLRNISTSWLHRELRIDDHRLQIWPPKSWSEGALLANYIFQTYPGKLYLFPFDYKPFKKICTFSRKVIIFITVHPPKTDIAPVKKPSQKWKYIVSSNHQFSVAIYIYIYCFPRKVCFLSSSFLETQLRPSAAEV